MIFKCQFSLLFCILPKQKVAGENNYLLLHYLVCDNTGGTPMKEGYVVPTIEKIAYGLGDLAINIAYTTIGFYFLFFLVNVAGLPAQWAGIIFFIARAWDAITDPLMGMISDRTKSQSAISAIRYMMVFAPGICFLISVYFVSILPITREGFDEIKKALEERKRK